MQLENYEDTASLLMTKEEVAELRLELRLLKKRYFMDGQLCYFSAAFPHLNELAEELKSNRG